VLLSRASVTAYVSIGVVGYVALRTGAAYAAVAGMLVPAVLCALGASGWVIFLLVLAIVRRHRTVPQATGDFVGAIGVGYVISVIVTTPARLKLDPTPMPDGAWPILAVVTVFGIAAVGLVAALLIWLGRRFGPGPTTLPPAA
jgi:hypothetical protein